MSTLPAVLGGTPAFPQGLPLVRPTLPDTGGLARRLQAVLDSGILTNGPTVRALEEAVAEYVGVRHVVAVASCTAGLMLVYQALDVTGPVVLPSFTFAASAHAVHWAGGRPRFADVDPATLTLDPRDAAARMEGAEAVSATHVYGTPCDVEALERLAAEAAIPLVYDAAHALGSRRAGRLIGGFGTAEVFSLSPTKVTVAGEGGLITTDEEALAQACRLGRDYGNPGDYDCLFPGLNARMSELHATIALASLEGLDQRVAHRSELAAHFAAQVRGYDGIALPLVTEGDTSTFKDLTILVDREALGLGPEELAAALKADGIDSRRYYSPPIHRQKAYAHLGPPPPLAVTERVADQVLTLPLWSHMTIEDVQRVGEAVLRIADHAGEVADALAGRF